MGLLHPAVEDLERRERERDAIIAELNGEIETGALQADAGRLHAGARVVARIGERRSSR